MYYENESYLDKVESARAADYFYELIKNHLIDFIKSARRLSEKEFLVLRLRSQDKSFVDIGLEMGISRQGARKFYQNAIKKMEIRLSERDIG